MPSASPRTAVPRKAASPAPALVAMPGSDRRASGPAPELPAAGHIAKGEWQLAAATLIPLLDAADSAGSAVNQQAAAVLRGLLSRPAASGPRPVPAEEHLSATLRRLLVLLRDQERDIARLEAMLDRLA